MPDILIRGVSAEAMARLDAEAAAQGLSRNEYLRRQLEGRVDTLGVVQRAAVTRQDLQRASQAAADLLDSDVMSQAWS